MSILNSYLYLEDVELVAKLQLPWEKLANKSIVISGATGLIGSFLIDVIMWKNTHETLGCRIVAIGRNYDKAIERFSEYLNNPSFLFVSLDLNKETDELPPIHADYVVHLASNTHPLAYATHPIETIITNIIGTRKLLELASNSPSSRFLFASSNEIYGENRGDVDEFDEEYCGYINCNTLRAGYPESKRCGEALCQAYLSERGMDLVIPRITRSYGPTLLQTDTKALSQFIHKAMLKEDIVLKSSGEQLYSFMYVSDTVSGLLTVMLKGKTGEAYNISDYRSNIRLKDLASIVAKHAGTSVVFETPDETEKRGYSKATKAVLSNKKISELKWNARYSIDEGVYRTLCILNETR